MDTWLITFIAVACFFLGMPIILAMAVWVVGISYFVIDLSLANLAQTAFFGLETFAFLALPLFLLTGDLVREAGIAERLAAFAHALVKWLVGGLAMATIVACGFFAAISGSNAATTATMGSIMIPEMTRRGYDRVFAAATAAAGGTVGVIIPPSIIFVVYGIIMNVSPVDLFIAGIIPGILMVFAMMFAIYLVGRWQPSRVPQETEPISITEAGRTAWGARHGFVAVALILGGIYMGWFSPTEAAGIAVAYAWLAGLVFTRQLSLRQTPDILHRSAQVNGLLVPIVALSLVLQQAISLLGVADAVQAFMAGFGGRWPVTIAIIVIILAVGTVFESVPHVIMTAPLLAPAAYAVGIDPVQFALIFLVGDTLGFISMPYGLNLFVASSLTGIPYMRISVTALWYCAALTLVLILVAAFPALTLFLVHTLAP